jgi:hypothetical protein
LEISDCPAVQVNTTDAGQFRRAADLSDDELPRIVQGLPPVLALQALPAPELEPADEPAADREPFAVEDVAASSR